jgi:hypothetical protein
MVSFTSSEKPHDWATVFHSFNNAINNSYKPTACRSRSVWATATSLKQSFALKALYLGQIGASGYLAQIAPILEMPVVGLDDGIRGLHINESG